MTFLRIKDFRIGTDIDGNNAGSNQGHQDVFNVYINRIYFNEILVNIRTENNYPLLIF